MAYNSWGNSRFPLAVSGTIDTAAQLDTGLQQLAALLAAAVNADCGDMWRHLVNASHERHFLGASVDPVAHVIAGIRPSAQVFTQLRIEHWPVLCVYREGSEFEWNTADIPATKQRWGLDWIVGPIGPDSLNKFGAFWLQVLHAMSAVVIDGHHPAFLADAECFIGQFVQILPTSESGAGISDELTSDKGAGYFGGSLALESLERYVSQSGAAIDLENAAGTAYAPVDAGYGDPVETVMPVLVTVTIPLGTPEPVGD